MQQRDSNTCYLFWNQYEQYHGETRMRGDMVRRPLGEVTSEWDLGARSDNGEEHVRTVEDGKNLS